jgi:UDP-glucose 4-epimerase
MTILVTGGAGYIGVPFVSGSTGDRDLVKKTIERHGVTAIIHFAASVVVPDSISNPLGYYRNNTMNTCTLLDAAIECGVRQVIFSSTAAVYGNAEQNPVPENAATSPISPYGTSKLMSEIMLHDTGKAHGLRFVILRYFNVAGADPKLRTGQATAGATHLIKVACEAALGKRPKMDIYGTDFPTPDGTGIRDYIHVSDLARAHSAALAHLRRGGESKTFNCGYGKGASVLEVVDSVRRISGRDFPVEVCGRRPGDPAALVANVDRIRATLDWRPQFQDLDTIVAHAYAWERRLSGKRETAAA